MPHFLVVAAIVLVAWTLLSLPLGVLIGRRLRRVGSASLPVGCAYREGTAPRPERPTAPGAVPGCTARPCRAVTAPSGRVRPCAEPKAPGHRTRIDPQR
jgi:hypothetical protein